MSAYHVCCRKNDCVGLKQGIRGYHNCCAENECKKKVQVKPKAVSRPVIEPKTVPPVVNNYESIIKDIDSYRTFTKSSNKQLFKTDEQRKKYDVVYNAIKAYDFFETPSKYADLIYDIVSTSYDRDEKY